MAYNRKAKPMFKDALQYLMSLIFWAFQSACLAVIFFTSEVTATFMIAAFMALMLSIYAQVAYRVT